MGGLVDQDGMTKMKKKTKKKQEKKMKKFHPNVASKKCKPYVAEKNEKDARISKEEGGNPSPELASPHDQNGSVEKQTSISPARSLVWETMDRQNRIHGILYRAETQRQCQLLEDKLFGQTAQKPPPPDPVPELDTELNRVRDLKGDWHDMTDGQMTMLKPLFDAGGNWVGGKNLVPVRPDKIRNSMSADVKCLIESHRRNGYRIPSLLPKE